MSDLQKMLLVIGAVIILSVLAFNWFQERRHKKHIEKKIAQNTNDPLMQEISEAFDINEAVRAQDSREQEIDLTSLESKTEAHVGLASDLSSDYIDESGFEVPIELDILDEKISFSMDLVSQEGICVSSTGKLQEVIGSIPKRVQILGSDRKQKELTIVSNPDSIFERLRIRIQLTDRNGPLSSEQIQQIVSDVYAESVPTGAICSQVDIAFESQRAIDLKKFSDEVDLLFGLTIERARGQALPGEHILGLAKTLGMSLKRNGVFSLRDSDGSELFTLENRDNSPFVELEMSQQLISGITFLLDVTTVKEGIKTFNKMAGVAKQFADALNASICDDNSEIVTDSGFDVIRAQLTKIHNTMEELEIPSGSIVAKQLFS